MSQFDRPDERVEKCEWCGCTITVPDEEGPWVCGDCVSKREKGGGSAATLTVAALEEAKRALESADCLPHPRIQAYLTGREGGADE